MRRLANRCPYVYSTATPPACAPRVSVAPSHSVFDLGCLHGIPRENRASYAAEVAALTEPGALFLLYTFISAEDTGMTDDEVETLFGRAFKVERHRAWRRPWQPSIRLALAAAGIARPLPADHRHRARAPLEALVADVVLQLLVPDRLAQRLRDLGVTRARAQRPAQVSLDEREEAGAQLPLRRQTGCGHIARRTAR